MVPQVAVTGLVRWLCLKLLKNERLGLEKLTSDFGLPTCRESKDFIDGFIYNLQARPVVTLLHSQTSYYYGIPLYFLTVNKTDP